MAKRQSTPTRPTSAAPRMTDEEFRAKGMVPFLRPSHVNEGEKLRLTGFNVRKDDQFVLEVVNAAGVPFNLGIRYGSPDHRIMFHAFHSQDFETWVGAVSVTIAPSTRGGEGFVNIKDASPDEPPF